MTQQCIDGVHVLTLRLTEVGWRGDLQTVLPARGRKLEVEWDAAGSPSGWCMLAGDAGRYRTHDGAEVALRNDVPDLVMPQEPEGLLRWTVPPSGGDPVAILVLPEGRTLGQPDPAPFRVTACGSRVVAMWKPKRRPVSWVVLPATAGAEEEAGKAHRAFAVELPPAAEPAPVRPSRRTAVRLAAEAVLCVGIGAAATWMWTRHLTRPAAVPADATRGVALETEDGAPVAHYGKSYALVVGVDKYPSPKWEDLTYAKRDALAMADYLKTQGFSDVVTLLNEEAGKVNILHHLQNDLARRLQPDDRVVVFFAGHGYTERLGGEDWGYIVPFDGADNSATYISMEELQVQSQKMGAAKHQLFILDACYGGLLASRGGGVDASIPNYIQEVTRRVARQVLTAGGKNQRVLDGGPGGHSVFTGYLLEGLAAGRADTNGDGFITFAELVSYVVPRATNRYQTPASASLPGHGLGEFVFRVNAAAAKPAGPADNG